MDLLSILPTLPLESEEYAAIQKAAEGVLADERLLSLAGRYYDQLFETDALLGREISEWQEPEADQKLGGSMLFTVILFARACALKLAQKYFYNGEPIDFFKVSLRQFRTNRQRHDSFGMQAVQRFWMYLYLKPVAFELGRLAFEIVTYHFGYEVYQNPKTGEHIPFAREGMGFDEKGMPDEEGSFRTTFKRIDDTVEGYTFTDEGHLDFKKCRVVGYQPVLCDGDKAISVHIPGNDKLTAEAADASFAGARVFFDTYFPDLNYKAFVCSSWLLDTGLKQFVGENSNIVKFQKRFRIALAFKNGFSLFDNVFNVPKHCPIEELVPQNRFQKEILDMVKRGGSLYSGRGYILK